VFKKIAVWTALTLGLLLTIAIVLVVVALVFLTHSFVGGTLANGRAITAKADSCYLGLETSGNTAIVRTFRRTIEVTPMLLKVDGLPAGAIPANAKSVNISIERGEVVCLADGKTIKP
jgi:hypothetical protein